MKRKFTKILSLFLAVILLTGSIYTNDVSAQPVNGIFIGNLNVKCSDLSITVGNTGKLQPHVDYVSNEEYSFSIVSGNELIKLNSKTGEVIGVAAGTAKVKITATKGDRTGTKTVKVNVSERIYSHLDIAITAVNEDGNNSKYYLKSKPTIVANGGGYNNKKIELTKGWYSGLNGEEYVSGFGFSFTSKTVFTVTATLTDGNDTFTKTFDITDVPNYKGSGMSFYAYCAAYNCDDHSGIDIKLSYNDIVEYFYDVVYNCDGDIETYKDNEEYSTGETVTVKNFAPTKTGYKFVGWEYNGVIYKSGQTVLMGKDQITFKATWAKMYTVSYNVDGKITKDSKDYLDKDEVEVTSFIPTKAGYRFDGWKYDTINYKGGEHVTIDGADIVFTASWVRQYVINFYVDNTWIGSKTYDAGTDVSDYLSYSYVPDVSKNMSDWKVTTAGANINSINKDLRVDATTSTKTFTVYYYVDGKEFTKLTKEYGSSINVNSVEFNDDSRIFSGWNVTSGDPTNIKSDVVISGESKIKEFTVTYIVNGKTVKTENNVKYGTKATAFTYTPAEGYDFSGFVMQTENGDLNSVKKDLVLTGTCTIKTFVVKFVDYDGNELYKYTVNYGSQILLPANPERGDDKTEDGINAAKWFKYNFKEWTDDSTSYSLANLSKVTQNMTFTAVYDSKEVKVEFFVLNRGQKQPVEIEDHDEANYSEGIEGALYYFKNVANNDSAVAANLAIVPNGPFKLYNSNTDLVLNKDEYIKWYVIKEQGDNWQVDGIIMNQKYDLTINYVDTNGLSLFTSYKDDAVAGSDYSVTSPVLRGYSLNSSAESIVSGTMPYGNVVINVVYDINSYDLTIHYVYDDADGTEAQPDYTDTLEYNEKYSINTPDILGYTANQAKVEGYMPDSNQEITVIYAANKYDLTIEYVYDDSNETLIDTIETQVKYKDSYSYTSPVVEGYTPSVDQITDTMPAHDVNYKLIYSVNSHTLTIYYYCDGELYDTYSESYNYSDQYSVDSPVIAGQTPDKANVNGTMPDMNVTEEVNYTRNEHDLLIHYLYEDGSEAREDYSATLKYEDNYSVLSETIVGYTADKSVVEGAMPDNDVEVTVVYRINSHLLTINYVDDKGDILYTSYYQSYNYNSSYDVTSPEISGYTADKLSITGVMPDENVIQTVTYTPNNYNLKIVYEYADGTEASDPYTGVVAYKEGFSVQSPVITGYTSSDDLVEGTMPASDLEIKVLYSLNSHFLTINYYDNNNTLISCYTDTLDYDEDYEIDTPDVTGYTPDRDVVEGTMGDEDIVENVYYSINSYDLTIHYEYDDGSVCDDYVQSYNYNSAYSVKSPAFTGYSPDIDLVSGNITEDTEVTVYYSANMYSLTVEYKYADGNTAYTDYVGNFAYKSEYSVTSPTITGYTPSDSIVEGTMPASNLKLVVMYTINTHTVTVNYYYDDGTSAGNKVIEVKYNEKYSITTPQKTGYTADTDVVSGVMEDEDITRTVIYNINVHSLIIHYQYANGDTAFDDYVGDFSYRFPYEISSPKVTGYTADITKVSGEMPDNDIEQTVTYNINKYNLTVEYKYSDGSTAASDYSELVDYNTGYDVLSPVIEGYTASDARLSGNMPAFDLKLVVMYTVNTHTVTVNYYYDNGTSAGNKVINVDYNEEYSIDTDPITGYTPDRDVVEGTMGDENIEETVIYNINSHELVIHYMYSDGEIAYGDHVEEFDYNEAYSIESPDLTGFTPDKKTVIGTMQDVDVEMTVYYGINHYNLTIEYKYSDGNKAADDYTGVVDYMDEYNVVSPVINGYTASNGVVTGIMPASDLKLIVLYNINTHTVTVNYSYEDGTSAGNKVIDVNYNDEYSIITPSITGYTPDISNVSGTMKDEDVVYDVTYKINKHDLVIHYLYANGETAFDDYVGEYNYSENYSVNSPVLTGYTADKAAVMGSMPDDDVELTVNYGINKYNLTVEYIYSDGSTAADNYTATKDYNEEFNVDSPVITGHTASKEIITGKMPAADLNLVVMYTVNTHTVTVNYYYNDGTSAGNKVIEVKYNEDYSIETEPMTGYTPDIDVVEGTMGDENIEENVIYNINSHKLVIHYMYSDGGTAFDDYVGEYNYKEAYSIQSPDMTGYTADNKVISDIMLDEDKEFTVYYDINQYNLTVEYKYSDGSTAADSYTAKIDYNEDYDVESPVITGYTASADEITGTMPAADLKLVVLYSINTYTVTVNYYYDDGTFAGNKVISVKYNEEYSIETEPITGYTADIDVVEGVMGDEDIEETVTYNINSHELVIHYLYANGEPAFDDYVAEFNFKENYLVVSPVLTGYTADQKTIRGTMSDADEELFVCYEINQYTLTVKYEYPDGSPAADDHTEILDYDTEFEVVSPTVTGYTASSDKVTGKMPEGNLELVVMYTVNTHTVTIIYQYEDGTIVSNKVIEVDYNKDYSVETEVIKGHTADKQVISGTMGDTNISETVVYTPNVHNVTVHYVYADGSKAADDTVMEVPYGKGFNVNVPAIKGYKVNKNTITDVMIDEDMEFTVTYTANRKPEVENDEDVVDTGDSSNPFLMLALCAASGAALTVTVKRRKNKNA